MPDSPLIPVVDMSTLSCREGNFKCPLGAMGCSSPQISGLPASVVAESHEDERKSDRQVPALGPGQYDLMIIGDQPGLDDDKMDAVWIDTAGHTVIDFLNRAKIDLERVWLTKITKCRPAVRGRKPTVGEIGKCRDEHLRKEIELIMPQVVMVVGAPALRAFNLLGHGSLNAIHGRVFEAQFADWDDGPEFKVIPSVSPGTFYYRPDPKFRNRVGNDYVVARDLIAGKEPSPHFYPDHHVIDTAEKLEWLKGEILSSTLLGWDTESCGLGFRKSPVISYQFAWGWNPDQCAVLPIMEHDPDAPEEQQFHLKESFGSLNDDLVTQFMRDVFLTPHISKAAHNHKYDVNILRWGYGIEIEGFLYDTWTMKHQQDENPPSDLEFLCDLEFAWGDYGAEKRKITGSGKKLKNTYDKVPNDILYPYGATDALGTYRLACLHVQRLKAKPNLWKFHIEESEPLQRSLARAEFRGACVHSKALEILGDQFEAEQKKLLTHLRGTISKPDFNPGSNPQVLEAFLAMGVSSLDLEERKAASGYTTNKQKLLDIVESGKQPQAKFAQDLMTYRNKTKMVSTYIENCRNDLDKDGRVRYSWVIAGPVTGRLSCRFFHQIPKIDERIVMYGPKDKDGKAAYVPFAQRLKDEKLVMRDMFLAPEGSKYVYGDYSQVELRILAILANDIEMLKIMADPNGDLHAVTAFEFLKTVYPDLTEALVSKFNRTEVGKRVNFGLAYGSEGHALVKTGKWQDAAGNERAFTWAMLESGMAAWKGRFTGVGDFIDTTPDLVRNCGGTATNVFGRERHFGTVLTSANDYERAAAEREAVNFFIQSVAASITNRTIIAIDKMLADNGIGEDTVCLVNTVHDSVAYEVKDTHVDWFLKAMAIVSEAPFQELGGATFKIDCGVGQNWTDAEMAA
jgi:uracil-DNA glycosylase family 4